MKDLRDLTEQLPADAPHVVRVPVRDEAQRQACPVLPRVREGQTRRYYPRHPQQQQQGTIQVLGLRNARETLPFVRAEDAEASASPQRR